MSDYYSDAGLLTHEERAHDGERLDHYLARVHPEIGDRAFWYRQCDTGKVDVRDHWDPATGTFGGKAWYLRWFDGRAWVRWDLEPGERPRMRHGYCHIVKE